MYINKRNKKGTKKPYYNFIPAFFLSLFLVLIVVFLTGMGSVFSKDVVGVYDEDKFIGTINLTWERGKENDELFGKYANNLLKGKHLEKLDSLDIIQLVEKPEKVEFNSKNSKEKKSQFDLVIKRSFDVKCQVFGEEKKLKVSEGETVESLLNRNGIKGETVEKFLNRDEIEDKEVIFTSPTLETVLKREEINDNEIGVTVNKFETRLIEEKEETIPFIIKEEQDDSLKDNERKLKQKGENGLKKIYKKHGYMDGELKEEITIEKDVKPVVDEIYLVKKPVPQKVEKLQQHVLQPVGNKEVSKPKEPSQNKVAASIVNAPVEGVVKVMQGIATAYAAKGTTARMGPARYGIVAVDPNKIPLGTRMFISGYGYCVAGDICGAAIKGKVLVDLCFNTEAECRKFGRRKVTIYILGGPAAAKVNIASISNKSQNKAPKNSKAKRVSQKHKPNKEGEKDSIKKVKKADVLENANKTKKDKISNKGGQEIIKKENKKTVKT